MDWRKAVAYITGTVDEELLLRNEHLSAENRILIQQLQGRLRLNDPQRQTGAGAQLAAVAVKKVVLICKLFRMDFLTLRDVVMAEHYSEFFMKPETARARFH